MIAKKTQKEGNRCMYAAVFPAGIVGTGSPKPLIRFSRTDDQNIAGIKCVIDYGI